MNTEKLNETFPVLELSSIENWLAINGATPSSAREEEEPEYGCVWLWG